MNLSERARGMSPSPTLALDAKVKAEIAGGADIINFGVGEPDFDTPEPIKEAAIRAIRDGFTKYTPTPGIPELRRAIAEKLERDNGLSYAPDEVVVAVGAKHALYNAFQVLLDPGDEVLLPAPYWVSYPEQILLAGGRPAIVETTERTAFKVTPEMLAEHLGPRTRGLLLNSPSNPTGSVYSRQELEAIGEFVLKHDLFLVSDEIYEKLIYDGERHVSPASLSPEIRERTIVVNGVSKAFAMTGWRIGYAAGPRPVIRAMGDLQSQSTSNPTSIAQVAALAALRAGDSVIRPMVEEFDRRRRVMVEGLAAIPGFELSAPKGAFYAFPGVAGLLGGSYGGVRVETGDELAEVLLTRARVAVVPGGGFGSPKNLRFSYSTSLDRIREGLSRIREAVQG